MQQLENHSKDLINSGGTLNTFSSDRPVLITGANGFTGSILAKMLKNSGVEIIPLVQKGFKSDFKEEIEVDFCDDQFPQQLRNLPPVSAVVHLGTRVGWDGSKRQDLFKPNIWATTELVEWSRKNDSYFIFASAALIAGTNTPFISEKTGYELKSDNDYIYSKWLAEHIISMSGIRHAHLRISGIFGAGGPSHLGINRAINDAIKGSCPVQFGSGQIKRNYIYVKDLCLTINHCLKQQIEGTLLVGGSQISTVKEMLELICTHLLPGQNPVVKPGNEGHDQVIEPSSLLPGTRSFEEAMTDILTEIQR